MFSHKYPRMGWSEIHNSEHHLQLLHWQAADSLGSRLGLEDARLLGEGVHTLACCCGWLLLQLHVQATSKLEGTVLLQLGCGQVHQSCNHCPDLLWFELGSGCNCVDDTRLAQHSRCLHGFHCLHGGGHCDNSMDLLKLGCV